MVYPQVGDIVLTKSNSLMGKVIAAYQWFKRKDSRKEFKDFIPTHAALVLDRTHVIHSVKTSSQKAKFSELLSSFFRWVYKSVRFDMREELTTHNNNDALKLNKKILGHGVDIDTIEDLLKGVEFYKVIRPNCSQFIKNQYDIYKTSLYHLDKPYNALSFLGSSKYSNILTFCSQLIHDVYDEIGVNMPSTESTSTLPVDLYTWAKELNWQIYENESASTWRLNTDETGDISGFVEMHRASIYSTLEASSSLESLRNLETVISKFASINEGKMIPPRYYKNLNIDPLPISSETACFTANKISNYMVFLEENESDNFEDTSWMVNRPDKDEVYENDRPDIKLSEQNLITCKVYMDDFASVCLEVINELEERVNNHQHSKEMCSLEDFNFLVQFFDTQTPHKKLAEHQNELTLLHDKLNDEIKETRKQLNEETIVQSANKMRKLLVSYYYCLVASDYVSVSQTVSSLNMQENEHIFSQAYAKQNTSELLSLMRDFQKTLIDTHSHTKKILDDFNKQISNAS